MGRVEEFRARWWERESDGDGLARSIGIYRCVSRSKAEAE